MFCEMHFLCAVLGYKGKTSLSVLLPYMAYWKRCFVVLCACYLGWGTQPDAFGWSAQIHHMLYHAMNMLLQNGYSMFVACLPEYNLLRTHFSMVLACLEFWGCHAFWVWRGIPELDVLNGSPDPDGSMGASQHNQAVLQNRFPTAFAPKIGAARPLLVWNKV